MNKISKNFSLNPKKWGIDNDFISSIHKAFNHVCKRFKTCFKTKTSDMSKYAVQYIRGLMELDNKRNIKNISRRVNDIKDDGQKLQNFITDSPWSSDKVFQKIQEEISNNKDLSGGILTLDDSGDRKSGRMSAGVGRQYIGRDGKVENGQVGVCLGYFKSNYWFMVDGELYIPDKWFEDYSKECLSSWWYIPSNRVFNTKYSIGMDLILRAKKNNLPFSFVSSDGWYGRDSNFRNSLDKYGIRYVLDVPLTLSVLSELNLSNDKPNNTIPIVDNQYLLFEEELSKKCISDILKEKGFDKHSFEIRDSVRGVMINTFYFKVVDTIVSGNESCRKELLIIRQDVDGSYKSSLSNALDVDKLLLCKVQCSRYFIDRTFQDMKSEFGWDELLARKYRSYLHHLSLCSLSLYILMLIKSMWKMNDKYEKRLKDFLEIRSLPCISISSIRELFTVLLPLHKLSVGDVSALIVSRLMGRCKSMSSMYRKQIRADTFNQT